MKNKFIIGLFLISIAFIYGCSSSDPTGEASPQALQQDSGDIGINQGQTAPDFTIKTVDEKEISLSSLTQEKPTVLYFFATWCPNCARDLAAVNKVYPQYKDKVNFLAIGMDVKEGADLIRSYRQSKGLGLTDFAAGNNNVLGKYNVVYTTTKFFMDKDRKSLNKGIGAVDETAWNQIFQSMSQ